LQGAGRGAISIKEILGENRGLASNQTKIQFKKKIIFIIEHIKKTRIFLKKKIEKINKNKNRKKNRGTSQWPKVTGTH